MQPAGLGGVTIYIYISIYLSLYIYRTFSARFIAFSEPQTGDGQD